MNLGSLLLWGFIATIVLTGLMSASQGLGMSRMSMPFLVGTMVTANRGRAPFFGFLVHLLNGWIFATIYILGFESLGRANWWLGALAGAIHGLFVLLVGMQTLPSLHPRMAHETDGPTPTRQLQPPGFLALHYGRRTPLVTLLAHIAYGAIMGGFYHVAG